MTRVVEYIRNGHRFGLAVDEDDAKRCIGTEAAHLYEMRPVDLDVVFLLDQEGYDGGPYRAFATYAAAVRNKGADDDIVVWELES